MDSPCRLVYGISNDIVQEVGPYLRFEVPVEVGCHGDVVCFVVVELRVVASCYDRCVVVAEVKELVHTVR